MLVHVLTVDRLSGPLSLFACAWILLRVRYRLFLGLLTLRRSWTNFVSFDF